jgi:hypothetical protein
MTKLLQLTKADKSMKAMNTLQMLILQASKADNRVQMSISKDGYNT